MGMQLEYMAENHRMVWGDRTLSDPAPVFPVYTQEEKVTDFLMATGGLRNHWFDRNAETIGYYADKVSTAADLATVVPKKTIIKGVFWGIRHPRQAYHMGVGVGGKALNAGKAIGAGCASLFGKLLRRGAKSGLDDSIRLTPEELATGRYLEQQLGKILHESPHEGAEFIDDLGRTYDALGTPQASQYWNWADFEDSINRHLLKSNDFTVIDVRGFTPDQIATVRAYVDSLPESQRAKIIAVGF